jgi:tryptophan 2,3-dioxygenase
VKSLLEADDPHAVQHTLKRVLTILKVLVAQIDILETMTPLSSCRSASGSIRQRLPVGPVPSARVRARPQARAAVAVRRGTRARQALEARWSEPTCGTPSSGSSPARATRCRRRCWKRDVTANPVTPSPELQQILVGIYRNDPKNAGSASDSSTWTRGCRSGATGT